MDKIIFQLKEHRDNLDVLILILEGCFSREHLEGSLILSEQIQPYIFEGTSIQNLINLILRDYGNDTIKFCD